jgi:hypothetical protein
MSALDSSRSLNALNLKPQNAAITALSAKSADKASEANADTSKATFSRLLAHSRAAAAAQQPPVPPARSAANPASPGRAARHAAQDTHDSADGQADAVGRRAPDAPTRPSAAARSGRADAANDAPDHSADTDASAETADGTESTDGDAHPARADGSASDLASLLALGVPPAPAVTPAAAATGAITGDAATDPLNPAAARLAALGKPFPGAAGIDASAGPAVGVKSADAIANTLGDEPGLGAAAQAPASGDPNAAIDVTAAAGALPNAALANLAALSASAGKLDEAAKTTAVFEVPPSGVGSAIPGHGLAHLARSIEAAAPATATVSTAVGDPGFHEALAAQVSVFARGGLSKAELHLNPAELGPVSVQITMNGDQARVDFGADRAQTRQVIEAGWAELATALKGAGFTLSGGGVSEQAQRQASQQQTAPRNGRTDRSVVADDVPVASIVAARPRAGSALDLYA